MGIALSLILRLKTGCNSNHLWPLSFFTGDPLTGIMSPLLSVLQFMIRLWKHDRTFSLLLFLLLSRRRDNKRSALLAHWSLCKIVPRWNRVVNPHTKCDVTDQSPCRFSLKRWHRLIIGFFLIPVLNKNNSLIPQGSKTWRALQWLSCRCRHLKLYKWTHILCCFMSISLTQSHTSQEVM